jgi:hypothetical protein
MSRNFDFRVVSEGTPIISPFSPYVRSDVMFILCSPEAPNSEITHSIPLVEMDGKYFLNPPENSTSVQLYFS